MNYAQKIEKQRQRFYSPAKSIIRAMLKSYSADLMSEINKATTAQQMIVASEKQLSDKPVENALLKVYGKTMPFFAQQTVKQLKPKKATPETIEEDYWQAYIKKYVKVKLAKRIKDITAYTETLFKEIVRNIVYEGIKEGYGIDKIAREIGKELNITERYRSERIARTEVVSASNSGSLAGAESTDLDLLKEWISYIDDKTRDSHRDMNEEKVEMDSLFSNRLLYPGDPGGDADEVINCRCTIGYITKESNFAYGREIPAI